MRHLLPSFAVLSAFSLVAACGGTVDTSHGTNNESIIEPPPSSGGSLHPMASPILGVVNGEVDSVAIDAEALYFWVLEDGSIYRLPKDGKTPPTVIASVGVGSFVEGLASDGTDVYFTVLGNGTNAGSVRRVPVTGGPIETLATGQNRPWGIALGSGFVYWANQGDNSVGAPGNDGAIMALPKQGGAPVTVSAGEWLPMGITVSGFTLAWNTQYGAGAAIRTLSVADGEATPVTLASNLDYPSVPVVADDGTVAWMNVPGAIDSAPLSGGAVTVLQSAASTPSSIAAHGDHLYYADDTTAPGSIWALALGGGAAVQVASAPVLPANDRPGVLGAYLLVDATHAFVFDTYVGADSPYDAHTQVRAYTF
jgi:hypothetical protein